MELFIFILETIGTIAFASSGAMTAIEKDMDILGVSMLGMTTAVGGGIIRDLILGITPPSAFQKPTSAILAIIVSVFIFIITGSKNKDIIIGKRANDNVIIILDSIGLGIFTVVGVNVVLTNVSNSNLFLLVFLGVTTGVGGGILRDLMSGRIPYIFSKHVYASASTAGAALCAVLWPFIGKRYSMMLGAIIVITIRLLAAYYKWNLPKVHGSNRLNFDESLQNKLM